MYMDAVVFAGIATVLLMIGFLVAVGVFVMRDAKQQREGQGKVPQNPTGKPV
ncbi:MAG: cytochrome c oxidase subunit CcoM [Marinobacter sp.]|uniref:cytochrome c oxidase subunit CcoM n=1 Tax=Marinobacter sp. TaxID=50741 RepID=UPI003C3808B2